MIDVKLLRSNPNLVRASQSARGESEPLVDDLLAADEARRKRQVVMVDVTGDAAVAKVELDFPDTKITDYFALLKAGNEWKIVHKWFTRAPKNR